MKHYHLLNIILWALVFVLLCIAVVDAEGGGNKEVIVETKMVEVPTIVEREIYIEEELNHRNDIPLAPELQIWMQKMAKKYNVPYNLLLAIAETESGFNPDAVSTTGDYGLMQINKINHEWLAAEGSDPMTRAGNIEAGAKMISRSLELTDGDIDKALMIYNHGHAGAQKKWSEGVLSTAYTDKVVERMDKWARVLGGEQ